MQTEMIDDWTVGYVKGRTRRLVGQWGINHQDAEDIAQDILIHLAKAVSRCDPALGEKRHFIAKIVTNQINSALKTHSRPKHQARRGWQSLDLLVEDADGRMIPQSESVSNPRQSELDINGRRVTVNDLVAQLPTELQTICHLLRTHNIQETAKALGRKRAHVDQALIEIRAIFTRHGVENISDIF